MSPLLLIPLSSPAVWVSMSLLSPTLMKHVTLVTLVTLVPRLRRLELSPSSLVTGCTILDTRSKWILMAQICFTAPTTNLLSLFTSLLKLQLSRIWKCNHKRHCFFCEQIFFLGCLLAELYNFSLVILSGVNLQNLKLNKSAKFIKKQLFEACIREFPLNH